MQGLRLARGHLLFACGALLVLACGDASLQPSAARSALSEDPATWVAAPLIPPFTYPRLATFQDRVVLLGDRTLEMWEWDGSAWAARSSTTLPIGRTFPGLVQLKDKLVLFGGAQEPDEWATDVRNYAYANDTWEWNGRDWTHIYPLRSPAARAEVAIAPFADKALMFGGGTNTGALRDTWTWNGRDWIQQKSKHAPEYCSSPAAALGGKVLMFCAAREASDRFGHTYEWDGIDWQEKLSNTRPSNRYSHTLASFGDRVVMFGGYADSGNWQETWVWDGVDWTDLTVQPSPPARDGYQTAQLGADLVLYGGATNETWAWNGKAWRIVAPASMPPARADYALTAVGDKVILFGGCCKSGFDESRQYWDDTWQWDGVHWTLLAPKQSPPGRSGTVLSAVDSQSALLFGGVNEQGVLADTWQWDAQNVTWTERVSAHKPSARQRHAMAALNGKIWLYGGASTPNPASQDQRAALGDLWAWDGDTWQQQVAGATGAAVPAPGYDLALGSFGSSLLLFTGDDRLSYSWDGRVWTEIQAAIPTDTAFVRPVYLTTVTTGQGSQRLVASAGLSGSPLMIAQWDGSSWTRLPIYPFSAEAALAQAKAQPMASLHGKLIVLSGLPLHTWLYDIGD